MGYETIITAQHGRVLLIMLNRPKALNALNSQLAAELIDGVSAADRWRPFREARRGARQKR
ncbi:hypothetical protein CHELA40_12372 [Chelatococcus asaccharovorans]|nr:hypothetical protein CHELA40_12372 [Chelatococcus asaccharovorans]CAH1682860.1 hypothetical protein CHELA17_63235 [Chelatococcus asaccharovorans]